MLGRDRSPYLLVTPVHDEVDALAELVATVRAQELRPALWLVVDDDSHDGTADELRRLARHEPWIQTLRLERDAGTATSPVRYAEVLLGGFAAAAELAEAEGVAFGFVAHVDADVRCPPSLFAELVERAARDRMIGVMSCQLALAREDGDVVRTHEPLGNGPRGGLRLWRRECLEELALRPMPHFSGVTTVLARSRGWKVVSCEDLCAEVVRADASRGGWWQGYHRLGEAGWFVGSHPLLVALDAVVASASFRDLRGVAMVAGYVESALRRRRQSSDPDVLKFFGDELPRERLGWLFDRLRPRKGGDAQR